MKIVVDHDKCSGHARCAAVAADFYYLDDEGFNKMPPTVVPKDLEDIAVRGARACPEQAITIIKEDD